MNIYIYKKESRNMWVKEKRKKKERRKKKRLFDGGHRQRADENPPGEYLPAHVLHSNRLCIPVSSQCIDEKKLLLSMSIFSPTCFSSFLRVVMHNQRTRLYLETTDQDFLKKRGRERSRMMNSPHPQFSFVSKIYHPPFSWASLYKLLVLSPLALHHISRCECNV